jgi:hypothetical protein
MLRWAVGVCGRLLFWVDALCVVVDAIVERVLLAMVDGIAVAVVSVVSASGSDCCVVDGGGTNSYGFEVTAMVGVNAIISVCLLFIDLQLLARLLAMLDLWCSPAGFSLPPRTLYICLMFHVWSAERACRWSWYSESYLVSKVKVD